jgi:hypothetical protein
MDLTVTSESWGDDDQTWCGAAHGMDMARSITLDTSAFTAGTHFPDGYVRSGTPLARITATGLYGPYNNAGAGGLETLAGFLFSPVKMSTGGADVQGALLEHGRVVEANLPIAIDSAGKTDLAGRVTFV